MIQGCYTLGENKGNLNRKIIRIYIYQNILSIKLKLHFHTNVSRDSLKISISIMKVIIV